MATEDNGGGHRGDSRPLVVLVSSPTPAEITYGPLLATFGDDVRAIPKNLEVRAGEATPPGYGFGMEVEGIKRVADEAGEGSVHLVGFSAGASACLAFAAKYPDRASSLALVEPPFIGREGRTPEEAAFFARSEAALSLPPAERMGPFVGMVLGPGARPPEPPPGPPPPWMMRLPIVLGSLSESFKTYDLDAESLRGYRGPAYFARGPAYFARGALSNPVWDHIAERLGGILPDLEVEVYEERHHLDAPHSAEPERFARALAKLWAKSGTSGEAMRTT